MHLELLQLFFGITRCLKITPSFYTVLACDRDLLPAGGLLTDKAGRTATAGISNTAESESQAAAVLSLDLLQGLGISFLP